jgi:orotate phosphoribosyltransferase
VDDVFTTGATATACARLLKRAGALSVEMLALARVDRRAPAPFPRAHETVARRAGMEMDETSETGTPWNPASPDDNQEWE